MALSLLTGRASTIANQTLQGPRQDYSTEAHLIYLSQTLIKKLNARLYADPFIEQHVSPSIHVEMNGSHAGTGLSTYIDNYKTYADMCHEFQVDTGGNASAEIENNKGTVILSQDIQAYEHEDRRMSGTLLMTWSRKQTKWVCNSVCMMLGTPEFLP